MWVSYCASLTLLTTLVTQRGLLLVLVTRVLHAWYEATVNLHRNSAPANAVAITQVTILRTGLDPFYYKRAVIRNFWISGCQGDQVFIQYHVNTINVDIECPWLCIMTWCVDLVELLNICLQLEETKRSYTFTLIELFLIIIETK